MTMSRTKSGIDPEIIRELANLLTETDLTEIEVQQADLRIRVAGIETNRGLVRHLRLIKAADTLEGKTEMVEDTGDVRHAGRGLLQ